MLAGGGGVAGRGGQDSWTRSALLRRRGSNVVGGDPFDNGDGDKRVALHCNPGRCGGRVRQEAVERLQRLLRWGRNSGHGGYRWGRGPVSSDLLVGLFEILFQESDLLLHGVDQVLHLSVCLLVEYLLYSPSGCFLSAAQASSLTEPMPRRVSRASFASSQAASSSKLERMLEPVAPMKSWHQVILLVSSPTSPS